MDDVMKKVENLLFSEDEEPTEEPKEPVREVPKVQKPEPVRRERQEKKTESFVEIEGSIESIRIADTRIKVASGCEIETGGLRFVFEEGSVKVYGA